jgi:hypothetical protein
MSNGPHPAAPQPQSDMHPTQIRSTVELLLRYMGSVLGLILVLTLCYLLIFEQRYDMQGAFVYILLLVVGFNFTRLDR